MHPHSWGSGVSVCRDVFALHAADHLSRESLPDDIPNPVGWDTIWLVDPITPGGAR
jgi:hypothetical protein